MRALLLSSIGHILPERDFREAAARGVDLTFAIRPAASSGPETKSHFRRQSRLKEIRLVFALGLVVEYGFDAGIDFGTGIQADDLAVAGN
jgi:hypothetical protein